MGLTAALSELERQFGIPGTANVDEGQGALPRVTIAGPEATGEIYLHGAQVTSWKPAGNDEVLFVSTKARWKEGEAIRGGIPICFPWFRAKADDAKAPAHGFVRTKSWQLESVVASDAGVVVSMFTESDAETRRWWPAEFRLDYRVTFGSELRLELACTNTGTNPLRFEEALHTYNRVANVREARLQWLDGLFFLDNTDSNKRKVQQGDVVISSPTDNAYPNSQNKVDLLDPKMSRRIRLTKANSSTTVVWNPWRTGAAGLHDLDDGEWSEFLCVEAGNIMGDAVSVEPGQRHTMTAVISVEKL